MVEGISGSPAPAGLVDRVKAILLTPKEEWPRIAADPSTPGDIVTRYAIPLIAIGPIASFVGGQIFGYGAFGFSYRPGLVAGLTGAIVQFVVSLVAWVGGVFGLIPSLGLIGSLLGLYSLYLLYLGATPVMKVPSDKAVGFTAVTVVVAIVAFWLASLLTAAVTAAVVGTAAIGSSIADSSGDLSGSVTIPGVGTIDADKIEQTTHRMEQM